jgi:hypothetical protein
MATPYISVVIAARNDNHGGNMLGRMQACVDSWLYQAKRLNLDSELIVVDWNPPAGRAKLIDDLRWPADCRPVAVRFIEVSPELHKTFANPVAIPLQQMIAKNAGIRRARGEYVVATNLDVIFSAELMEFLASRTLEHGAMYRMDRHDITMGIPNHAPVEELLDFARRNVLRVFNREGAFSPAPGGTWNLERPDVLAPASGLRFGTGWYPPESDGTDIHRWMEEAGELYIEALPARGNTLYLDLEKGPSSGAGPLVVEFAGPGGEVLASSPLEGRSTIALNIPDGACPIKLTLHARSASVPLAGDLRFLHFRMYSADWIDKNGDVDLVFRSARYELTVTHESGNVLLHAASDELADRPNWGRFRLQLRLGDNPGSSRSAIKPETWSAEVVRQAPDSIWSESPQRASEFAAHIRRAAYLHTNASGDFTLLSRDDWFALRAYAEFPIWPTHLDSLFCYAAYQAGIREVILPDPMRIYHVEHFAGAGWTPEGDDELNARIARKGVTLIPYTHFVEWVNRMRRFDAPMIFTRSDWGLGDVELPESTR